MFLGFQFSCRQETLQQVATKIAGLRKTHEEGVDKNFLHLRE